MISSQDNKSTLPDKRPVIKILLLDYDNCLATIKTWENGVYIFNAKNNFLSPRVVALATDGNYQAFIGVTHRSCYSLQPEPVGLGVLAEHMQLISKCSMGAKYNYKDYFTYQITDNFQAKTHLPCLAVSTIDDYSATAPSINPCGYGYEKILKPYEEQVEGDLLKYQEIFPRDKDEHLPVDKILHSKIPNSKNTQIIQSINLAKEYYSKKFPGVKPVLEFHFLDDIKSHCDDIKSIKDMLPPDIILKSFQYNEHEQIYADMNKPLVTINTVVTTNLANQLTAGYSSKELKSDKVNQPHATTSPVATLAF